MASLFNRLFRHVMLICAACPGSVPAAAATLAFTVNTGENVIVTGTPRIAIDVGGVTRYATYDSGSGTSALNFSYVVQAGDFDANGIALVSPLDLNGGSITGAAGNPASNLTFMLPNTSGIKVQTYTADFTTSPITSVNASSISFTIAKAPPGGNFAYTITSSGGLGAVTGSGAVASNTTSATVTNVDISTLAVGTLTLSVTVSTAAGGTGAARSATATPTILSGALDAMPSAAALFSVRRLRASYTGPLLRVFRSSESTERDIAATLGGDLDTTTIVSFCGASTCSIRSWYDQSGNADAIQTSSSRQPRIFAAGTVDSHNSRPGLYFSGTSTAYRLASNTAFSTSYTMSAVASRAATATGARRLLNVGGNLLNNYAFLGIFPSETFGTFADQGTGVWTDAAANTPNIVIPANSTPVTMTMTIGSNILTPYINGTAQDTKNGTTAPVTGLGIGALYLNINNQVWDGIVSEVLVYSSVLSASDLASLQASQKAYYGTP